MLRGNKVRKKFERKFAWLGKKMAKLQNGGK